jgi:hypothetical protein
MTGRFFNNLRKRCRIGAIFSSALTLILIAAISSPPARAAEDAKGFYLLGSVASMGQVVPPPGSYFVNYKYFYTGDASANAARGVALDKLGRAALDVDIDVQATAFIEVPAFTWIAPRKFLNGRVGVTLLTPFGYQDVGADIDALATLTLTNGRTFQRGARANIGDDTFSFGDPLILSFIGWNRGNWHWRLASLTNIPIGNFDDERISNIAFNRWGTDVHGGFTWLDPSVGFEVTTNVGFTFNGTNPDTDYKTGTEFHVEYALMKHFSKAFSAGLVGYHYQQVTGDSGDGASLGDFKGRVTALGPSLNFNTQIRKIPISTSLRWYHEFNAKNRPEGDSIYLQTSMPLAPLFKR